MRLSSYRLQSKCDEENPYWISFSDIMSGLLVIFVMAVLALILELTQTRSDVTEAIKELAKAEQVRRDILNEIAEELRKKNIKVEVVDNHTVLRIPDELLAFENNKYTIPNDPYVQETVREIGKVLYDAITILNRWEYLDTIFVEGHTDRRPSPRKMGNWGLSTFRAISVWNFWNEELPSDRSLSELKNHTGKFLFSVSGYGATRSVTTIQNTEEEFRKNRRIDIRFTVKRPALDDFKNIKKLISE